MDSVDKKKIEELEDKFIGEIYDLIDKFTKREIYPLKDWEEVDIGADKFKDSLVDTITEEFNTLFEDYSQEVHDNRFKIL